MAIIETSPDGRITVETCRACHCTGVACRCGGEEHNHYRVDGVESYLCPDADDDPATIDEYWSSLRDLLAPRPWRYDRRHGWVRS